MKGLGDPKSYAGSYSKARELRAQEKKQRLSLPPKAPKEEPRKKVFQREKSNPTIEAISSRASSTATNKFAGGPVKADSLLTTGGGFS